ncbi:hypothetical protein DMENIID0001_022270 [Sergentomyia squamirostris]
MVLKKKKLKELLTAENAFVSNLLLLCDVPHPDNVENYDDDVLLDREDPNAARKFKLMFKKSPAELKAASDAREAKSGNPIKNRKTKNPNQKNKDKAARKEQRQKNKMMKVPAANRGKITVKKEFVKREDNGEKPRFNKDEKIIFNKIDFESSKKNKGGIRNPVKALEKLTETKKKIRHMMESGETEKALNVKSDLAWKKAFEKNEGKKVKDDKFALKKSIDRKESQKKRSMKNWQERKKKTQEKIDARVKKVEENKQKKSQEKLKKKVKRLQKRGKIMKV